MRVCVFVCVLGRYYYIALGVLEQEFYFLKSNFNITNTGKYKNFRHFYKSRVFFIQLSFFLRIYQISFPPVLFVFFTRSKIGMSIGIKNIGENRGHLFFNMNIAIVFEASTFKKNKRVDVLHYR